MPSSAWSTGSTARSVAATGSRWWARTWGADPLTLPSPSGRGWPGGRVRGVAVVRNDMVKPEVISLPFNCECLTGEFVPARHLERPPERQGLWFLIQKQCLMVLEDGSETEWRLPQG